jgi:hypothetical protein
MVLSLASDMITSERNAIKEENNGT